MALVALKPTHTVAANLPAGIVFTPQFVYQSLIIEEVLRMINLFAVTEEHVLLLGESGTGKEVLAQAIHDKSPRANKPFQKVNCACFSEELFVSELFGHERGSFTGAHEQKKGHVEVAEGGTIFLDEISQLKLELQAKLLRFLETFEYFRLGSTKIQRANVRIIAASNRDLQQQIKEGKFMEDLFYRLDVLTCTVPPLRDRREDVLPITRLIFKLKESLDAVLEESVINELMQYDWPGNVRELRNVINRTLVLYNNRAVPISNLQWSGGLTLDKSEQVTQPEITAKSPPPATLKYALKQAEKDVITRTLQENRWNRSRTAKQLGISYKSLLLKIKEHQIGTT